MGGTRIYTTFWIWTKVTLTDMHKWRLEHVFMSTDIIMGRGGTRIGVFFAIQPALAANTYSVYISRITGLM